MADKKKEDSEWKKISIDYHKADVTLLDLQLRDMGLHTYYNPQEPDILYVHEVHYMQAKNVIEGFIKTDIESQGYEYKPDGDKRSVIPTILWIIVLLALIAASVIVAMKYM